MSLVKFRARNHGQQVARRGALEKVDDRRTPDELWLPLHEEFQFTLDVAASDENALCSVYYTTAEDGLAQPWWGSVWCNPPYSDVRSWVEKAATEWQAGGSGIGALEAIVMLLPANRTEQGWWQERVEPARRVGLIESRFLPGRIRFGVPEGTYTDPRGNRPPFGCVLLIWRASASPTAPQPVGTRKGSVTDLKQTASGIAPQPTAAALDPDTYRAYLTRELPVAGETPA